MTFFWIVCIWIVAGLPLGMLVGSTIAKVSAEGEPLPDLDMDMGLEAPVCS